MGKIKTILQISYVCFLCLIFLFGFGITNFRKYFKDDSLIVLSKEILTNPIEAPAITICPINPISGFGLKTISQSNNYKPNETLFKAIWRSCEKEKGIGECVMDETYSLQEAVPNIALAGSYMNIIESIGHFDTDISCMGCGWGRCYTLKDNVEIMTFGKSELGPLAIALKKSLNFDIFIHDKKFFYISMNPGTTPGFRLSFRQGENLTRIVSVKSIKHVKRNTVSNPCHENIAYSFTDCIREKVDAKIGCLMPWKNRSRTGKTESCRTIEKLENYETMFVDINDKSPSENGDEYDCPIPCEFYEYILVEDLPVTGDLFNSTVLKALTLVLSSREIFVKREVQLYEVSSFVGDTGGSLGLFLGFSFFALWEWTVSIAVIALRKFGLYCSF